MSRVYDKLVKVGDPFPFGWMAISHDSRMQASMTQDDRHLRIVVRDEVTGFEMDERVLVDLAGPLATQREIEGALLSLVQKLRMRREPMFQWQCPEGLDESFWLDEVTA